MSKPTHQIDRQILVNLIASFALADHMGDVIEDCVEALVQTGVLVREPGMTFYFKEAGGAEVYFERLDPAELSDYLRDHHGAMSIRGTSLED